MSQKQAAVLAGLAIAVVSITACHKNEAFLPGAGHHYGQKKAREFRVYIYSDGQYPNACFADLAVATLWKNQQQTVTWVSDDGYEYTVDFSAGQHGSPFSQTSPTFDIPADKETKSGSLNVNASGYYDFLIRAGSASGPPCKKPTDPDPGYYVK
jgi:hypothetical protein